MKEREREREREGEREKLTKRSHSVIRLPSMANRLKLRKQKMGVQ